MSLSAIVVYVVVLGYRQMFGMFGKIDLDPKNQFFGYVFVRVCELFAQKNASGV